MSRGNILLQVLCTANLFGGVMNLAPYLNQWRLLNSSSPEVALFPLLLCVIILAVTSLVGVSSLSKVVRNIWKDCLPTVI